MSIRITELLYYACPVYGGSLMNDTRVLCANVRFIYLRFYSPLLDLGRFSLPWSFTQSVGFLGQEISQSQGRYLHTGQHQVGFEPTIPVFEWAKTVHALDSAATVIGLCKRYSFQIMTCGLHFEFPSLCSVLSQELKYILKITRTSCVPPCFVLGRNDRKNVVFLTLSIILSLSKDKTMDNVQKHNICTNVPSSHILDLIRNF
jgi:hypothetical protein